MVFCTIIVWNAWDSFISNTSIILNGIETAIIYCIFYKAEYETVVAWNIFYGISIAFVKLPYMILSGLIGQKTLFQVNRGTRNWGDVLYCILINIAFGIFIKNRGEKIRLLESLIVRHKRLLIFMGILLWSLLSYNMWLGKQGFCQQHAFYAVFDSPNDLSRIEC